MQGALTTPYRTCYDKGRGTNRLDLNQNEGDTMEVDIRLQMHLHDDSCGHTDGNGDPWTVETIDMVTDWFQYSAPSVHLGASGDPMSIVRGCTLVAKSLIEEG